MGDNKELSAKGKEIMSVKQEIGARMRSSPRTHLLLVHLGGKFQFKNHKTEYVGGILYMKEQFNVSDMKMSSMREVVKSAQKFVGLDVHDNFSIWHRLHGKNLTNGRKKIERDSDFEEFYKSIDVQGRLLLYVVDEPKLQIIGPQFRCKTAPFWPPKHQPIRPPTRMILPMSQPNPQSTPHFHRPLLRPNSQPTPPLNSAFQGPTNSTNISQPPPHPQVITQSSPTRKSNRLIEKNTSPLPSPIPPTQSSPTRKSNRLQEKNTSPLPSPIPPIQRTTPRVKHVATKKKLLEKKGKKKPVKRLFNNESDFSADEESGSELSDCEYNPGEEDRQEDVDDELFFNSANNLKEVLLKVQKEFGVEKELTPKGQEKGSTSQSQHKGSTSKAQDKVSQPRWEETEICLDNIDEPDCDSDEAKSLHGSDDEGEAFPTFNPEVDLLGGINLTLGLKFDSIYDLRKAVQYHSIQKRYSYFFRHNGSGRFEVLCRYRCECPYNPKKGKIMWCRCSSEKLKCLYKVRAVQLTMSGQYQIRDLHLQHDCGFFHSSNKVTSEFLAGKYLADWKSDPDWKLTAFIERVCRDTGVNIPYSKAWHTRCRVKQMLYGDGREQYAKVYQYAFALLKYNPGSTAIVSVTNDVSSTQPFFSRMYVCLEACKTGYKKGCRPIIGIDGCHLKGPYPGMILAAIGKDGNNNIFPIAWAIVEVENTSSWIWFLELLVNDTGHIQGEGLTLMSDRQKGLLEAMSVVTPKADVRFCVRHIWANFKLKFTGTIFKEFFWKAAKATTLLDFQISMNNIKFLSEEAYQYLEDIPPKHWSRHAFTATAKSNMVTNNMCETFNAVIKEARDKPVITCLEWIRRYIMRRHADKWDGAQTYSGKFMPYTGRVLGWVMEAAKDCIAIHSRTDEWEVDTSDDRYIVNLRDNTCSCNHFMLTGIPCAHAFSCIMVKRGRPEDFVDNYYSKDMFLLAYSSHIKPMPGFKHWEPCKMPEPLPPPFKNMPGRPKSKKRIKEKGEEEEGRAKKFKKVGGQQKCSKCGQPGHKMVKCKNPTATVPKSPPKKGGRPPSNDPWVIANKNKKEARANMMKYVHPSAAESSKGNNEVSTNSYKANKDSTSSSKANEASTSMSTKDTREKLPIKSSKKKVKSLSADLL